MKKSILFPLFLLAIIFLFGIAGWALSGHGTIGLLRVTPVTIYAFVLIGVLAIALIGLFAWYWRLSRGGGESGGRKLSFIILAVSILCIASVPYGFAQLGSLPHATDIKPISQLSIHETDEQKLHFAVGSDTHFGSGKNSPDQTAAMLAQISDPANKYDIFFFLGDLVEYGFKDSQWKEALDAFSPAASTVPFRFIPGNHDTLFGGLSRYIDYCGPAATESQNNSRLWYRVDVGRVHFLMLDVEWSTETFSKEQADWLETQLSNIPSGDWKIIMSHGFYYSSGSTSAGWDWFDNPETISVLAPLFERNDVDVVFSGHNHSLEFLQNSGVSYVVCGGFGGKLDLPATYISPRSIWLLSGQFGFVDVTINGNEATLDFRDPDSNVLKSFTIYH
jgi:UDP-2,3-diacylglucosamine pyrophosphatase LpxH